MQMTQYFCFRITEASRAFQMEKIENGYEIMSQFTVNLNREEKIIREIDFYRGMCFLSFSLNPFALFLTMKVHNFCEDILSGIWQWGLFDISQM